MPERLPSLDWVRVFEVAARTGSFATAAEVLSVSPGAVSRTIKELEQYLGIKLFYRLPRGVELTTTGREYAGKVAPALAQIAKATQSLDRDGQPKVLRVTAMPALGERWLVPRLGDFRARHPGTSVEVSADASVVNLQETTFDVALRYGDGGNRDVDAIKLFEDELYPVVSPKLLRKYSFNDYMQVFEVPVLQDVYWLSDWAIWSSKVGIETPIGWESISFTLYSMALSAAIAGHGIIMGHDILVKDEIKKGRLVAPFDFRVLSQKCYYLVENPNKPTSPSREAFVEWVVAQAYREIKP